MQEISFRNDILPLKDKLFRLALRITLDRAEAEDVVQDTMIRVWNKRDEWKQFESIEAYCLIVAKNLAIDRSQKKEAQNVELTSDMAEEVDLSGPYEQLVNDERMKIIHRLINELPFRFRNRCSLIIKQNICQGIFVLVFDYLSELKCQSFAVYAIMLLVFVYFI